MISNGKILFGYKFHNAFSSNFYLECWPNSYKQTIHFVNMLKGMMKEEGAYFKGS